jgi:hypothetical protein
MTRRRWTGWAVALLVGVSVTIGVGSTSAKATGASISAVAFSGSAANPHITITGSGFGAKPAPTNLAQTGYTGYDYGNALYVCDTSSGTGAGFCAGQNDGGGGDTIGLVVGSYGAGAVSYTLGSTYSSYYYPHGLDDLKAGNTFAVVVAGATCSGTISYTKATKCPSATPPPTTTTTTTPPPAGQPPVNTVNPAVSGSAVQGGRLTDVHGTWLEAPTSYTYQWQRCTAAGTGCVAIPGATAQTYVPVAGDIGHTLLVAEVGVNAYGSGLPASSPVTEPVLPELVRNRSLHARVVKSASKLIARNGARVSLSVSFTGRLAASLGVAPGTTATGSGAVNFRTGNAHWSLRLPRSLGGGVLKVVTHGSKTYLRLGTVTATARKPWIEVPSGQLTKVPRVGVVGALALLLNPYELVQLVRSTTARVVKSTAASGTSSSGGESCSLTPGIDGAQSAVDPSKLKTLAKDYKDSYRDGLDTLEGAFRLATSSNSAGALGSVELINGEGLTLTGRFCTAAEPPGFAAPPLSDLTNIKDWLKIDPCLVGAWQLAGPLPNANGDPVAAGTLRLTISPIGVANLVYDERSLFVNDGDGTATGLPNAIGGPDSIGVYGVATLTVLAPYAATSVGHKLVWSIEGDEVVQIFAGYVVDNEDGDVSATEPFEQPVGPSGVVKSSYTCDAGAKTLSVSEPIGNDVSLLFQRLSSPYKPPSH